MGISSKNNNKNILVLLTMLTLFNLLLSADYHHMTSTSHCFCFGFHHGTHQKLLPQRRRRFLVDAPAVEHPSTAFFGGGTVATSRIIRRIPSTTRASKTTTTTSLQMVLTTPEAIIEQASTQNLLDDLIDESVRTSARKPIMMQFDPSSGWIWKRWKGTVFSETWDSCVSKMMYAALVFILCKAFFSVGMKSWLSGFNILWGQLLSVTTFTLTFFVNQSYALWRKCYELSRRLQGRLHDLDMTLAAHATRKPPASPSITDSASTYTAASRQVLELVSRYVRLFNLLTYASFTRSHRPILTPRGMRRLVERGLMTSQERHVLVDAEIPATQRHNAVLLWIIRTFVEGREAGHFLGGAGFEEQFMEKIHVCRGQYGAIGDELQGRMPLAYAHIVQVLVDMILWMYPFMAFASGMSGFVTVLGTGLLTVSYQGLFDLAKQFLDPYDNESYGRGEDPLLVDTLIAETNAGSVRWMYGLEQYPVSSQRIVDGEISEYLLPVRGYSVEELDLMEEERLEMERKMQEKREKEKEERRKVEEEERRIREASEAMTYALINNTSTTRPTPMLMSDESLINMAVASSSSSVNGDTRVSTVGLFPGAAAAATVKTTTFSKALNASSVLDMMPFLESCEALIEDAVPIGTAPSVPEVVCFDEEKSEEETTSLDEDAEEEEYEVEYDEEFFDVDEGVDGEGADIMMSTTATTTDDDGGSGSADTTTTPYVHTFDSFEPYADALWYDEVDADGKEIRLSSMLADEVWEEELEAQREKEQTPPIHTYEEYAKRAAEIMDAEQSELLETKEILMESPGSQSSSLPAKDDDTDEVPLYDQTKLDGFSQLWGLPPNELSEIPGYEEPSVTEGEGDADMISQLWGGGISSIENRPLSNKAEREAVSSGSSFYSVSQLWGEEDILDTAEEDEMDVIPIPPSSPGTYRIKDGMASLSGGSTGGTRRIKDDDMELVPPSPVYNSEYVEPRMSKMLASEVWPEELEATVPVEPATLDDYTKQVQEILDAEEEELLETQAILNAPPGADSVDVPEMPRDDDAVLNANNSTADDVDLSVLEMDEPIEPEALVMKKDYGVVSRESALPESSSTPASATGQYLDSLRNIKESSDGEQDMNSTTTVHVSDEDEATTTIQSSSGSHDEMAPVVDGESTEASADGDSDTGSPHQDTDDDEEEEEQEEAGGDDDDDDHDPLSPES